MPRPTAKSTNVVASAQRGRRVSATQRMAGAMLMVAAITPKKAFPREPGERAVAVIVTPEQHSCGSARAG